MKKLMALVLAIVCLFSCAAADTTADTALEIDWNARYSFAELEAQMDSICEAYPDITEKYSIGHSWQERDLWCVEITNEASANEDKTGIAVFANIHGGERESATCAMYYMWWLTENSATEEVQEILENYVVYVIPVINPDGYEQSSIWRTRPNLRPTDSNDDGVPFSDPYTDLNGDGYISYLFAGCADNDMSWLESSPWITYMPEFSEKLFGMESPDWDGNGIPGDDARTSGIDLNRTFDYQWARYDIDNAIGDGYSFSTAGESAATEPEIQAVQNFLIKKDIDALATLHTGIQCVLYPWCYREYDETVDSEDILYMKQVASDMAAAYQDTTGRGFYSKSSWEDYPTSAELIDYSYGRLNIHSYTIEVYCPGTSATGDISECYWENELPEATLEFYDAAALTEMGLDAENLLPEGAEGLWFYTTSDAQMTNSAPEEQELMAEGCKDALNVMLKSEPYGEGKTTPWYLE